MATKQKLPVKRGITHLKDMTGRVFEASEVAPSKAKRRRHENKDRIFEYQDSVDSQSQLYDLFMCDASQQKYASKGSQVDQSKKLFSVSSGSSHEKNARSRFKKSYASLNKTGSVSKQIKTQKNLALSNKISVKAKKDIECKSAVKNHKGRAERQAVSESTGTMLVMTDNVQITNVEEENYQQMYDTSQAADLSDTFESEKGSIIYVQSPSLSDTKVLRTKTKKSGPSLIIEKHQQGRNTEPSEENCSTSGSKISNVAVSCVSHSHNPVLKPTSMVTGIPATSSMTSLSASTSAITAISTPIPTFPMLPDGFGDTSNCGVDSPEQIILTNGREDDNHTNMSSQQRESPGSASDSAAERHEQQDDLVWSCNGIVHHTQEIFSLGKDRDPCTDAPVPIVSIPVVNGTSSDKEKKSVGKADNIPVSKTDFHPLEVVKSNASSQQPSYLKVDTWGEYMLQNLELFYKKEKHCDFILKFHGGEVLKVHRTILLACTSLVSGPDAMEGNSELLVPADLNFASVEPVIRFVYSGHLEIQKSDSEMTAIYAAAKRLKVPLLTHVMDRHFPCLVSPGIKRLTTQGDSEEHVKQKKLTSPKSSSSSISLSKILPQSIFKGSDRTSATSGSKPLTTVMADKQEMNTRSFTDIDNTKRIKLEDCDGQESSVYYVVTNSGRYSHSNSPLQGKSVAEEARPTRFELEEESENSPLKIATWDPKCSSTSHSYLPVASQVSTPHSVYSCSSSSTLVDCRISETCSVTTSSLSHTIRRCFSNQDVKIKQPYLPGILTHEDKSVESVETGNKSVELINNLVVPNDDSKCVSVTDTPENHQTKENEHSKENDELMEKISSICKQLEEKESEDANEKLQKTECKQKKCKKELCLPSVDTEARSEKNIPKNISTPETSTPIKSILKKNKVVEGKEAKHVSFLLDKNNELINEVATFSLSREPSQSLIGVKKMTGNLKSDRDTCSSVQMTVSMKKKVLMNLSLSDSETFVSSSKHVKKSHGRKSLSTSSQNHSKSQVNKGDINNHAKIISEVLKKYPHLVKDKKKIRLKILKKSNEKEGGKAKSKVQYLVLSDKDSKSKPLTETYKALSHTKNEMSVPRAVKNQPTYECPECNNRTFQTYFMLKKHVTFDHQDKSSAILSRIENVPYACYTCFVNEPLEFGDYYSYQQHMKDVHSRTELRLCNVCGFRPGRKLELAYHQYTEHNKVSRSFCFPKCDLCDHVAINDAALLKHRSQHTNADNYTCSVCGVKFCSFGALQGHMQTKLCGTKPSVSHKCPFCPLTFTRSYNLKAHCKSCHRSQQTSAHSVSGSKGKESQNVMPQDAESASEKTEGNNALKNKLNSDYERNNTDAEMECETPTGQSSSEAEALSTVASSLVASLGLPEETMNQYMYPEANKMNHPNAIDEEKIEQVVSQPVGLAMHVEIPSASEYQDHPQCYDKPYSVQTSMQGNTSVSTLFPISVVPSEVVSNHIVPGQIIPSQILPSGCMSSSSGPVLGAAPQSWTYVTYQVPTTSEDLPVVLTETTSINAPSVNPDKNISSENVYQSRANMTTTEGIGISASSSRSSEYDCEELHTLSVTDSQTHVNISQAPHHSVTQCCDPLSSQYI